MNKIPMVPRVALIDLARMVQKVMKMQAEYFNKKTPSKLAESRDAERRLGERCRDIIEQPDAQATIFAEPSSVADEGLAVIAANRLEYIAQSLQSGKGDRASTVRELCELADMLGRSAPASEGGRR